MPSLRSFVFIKSRNVFQEKKEFWRLGRSLTEIENAEKVVSNEWLLCREKAKLMAYVRAREIQGILTASRFVL